MCEKANVPMITEKKACEKIVRVFLKNVKLRKIPLDHQQSKVTQSKLKDMESELSSTFPLWAKNADSLIKNDEDLKFLQSMKTDPTASFGAHDKKLACKLECKEKKKAKEEERKLSRKRKNLTDKLPLK